MELHVGVVSQSASLPLSSISRNYKLFYFLIFSFSSCLDGNQSNVFPTLDALKMMLVHRQRCVNSERSLAFAKRLATLSLAQPFHNNVIASLSVLRGIILVRTFLDMFIFSCLHFLHLCFNNNGCSSNKAFVLLFKSDYIFIYTF